MTGAVSPPSDALERGRDAYTRKAWKEAYEQLSAADETGALAADDLMLLGTAAFMLGRMDDFLEVFERAHHAYLEEGEAHAAIRCAFYLG